MYLFILFIKVFKYIFLIQNSVLANFKIVSLFFIATFPMDFTVSSFESFCFFLLSDLEPKILSINPFFSFFSFVSFLIVFDFFMSESASVIFDFFKSDCPLLFFLDFFKSDSPLLFFLDFFKSESSLLFFSIFYYWLIHSNHTFNFYKFFIIKK